MRSLSRKPRLNKETPRDSLANWQMPIAAQCRFVDSRVDERDQCALRIADRQGAVGGGGQFPGRWTIRRNVASKSRSDRSRRSAAANTPFGHTHDELVQLLIHLYDILPR